MGSKSKRHWPATCLTGVILAGLLAAASAQARSVTVENNCAEGPRCLRVYNDITRIEFCLDPGQSYTLDGLDSDATYCAWCNADRLPDDCKQWPVRFD
jgi:hypothetical protein